jgi:hypothetical protein
MVRARNPPDLKVSRPQNLINTPCVPRVVPEKLPRRPRASLLIVSRPSPIDFAARAVSGKHTAEQMAPTGP